MNNNVRVLRSFSTELCLCMLLLVLPLASQNGPAATKSLAIFERTATLLTRLREYPNLEVLSITCVESLKSLPDSIGTLTKLRELRIDNGNGCSMNPVLPESIGNLHSLERLVLYGAQDPRGPGPQPKERHKFPAGMSRLKNLKYLDLGRNGLEEIPAFVRDLPNLKELGFAWNMKVKVLPAFLIELRELTTLRLDSDELSGLPEFLNKLPKLTRITLGDNCNITQSIAMKKSLRRRFPRITFDFNDEYDCPTK